MRKKIAIYFIFVVLFMVGKLCFMLYHHDIFGTYGFGQIMAAIAHGLPHDLAMAGWLMALPFALQMPKIWMAGKWHERTVCLWLGLALATVLVNFVSDLVLYGYWGFRIDNTAWVYLLDNPAEALGQTEWWMVPCALLGMGVLWWPLYKLLSAIASEKKKTNVKTTRQKGIETIGALLVCALCGVAIRGGVSTSTMNLGRVYFSNEMPLNHAATNPLFSFFNSVSKDHRDFGNLYRFMSNEDADLAMQELATMGVSTEPSEKKQLLRNDRPDIVLIIFESFSGAACTGVNSHADPEIMPNVNRMYDEGIGFTNMIANSFRTDRGCASILASIPCQPTYSVMMDKECCNHLDYLSQTLKENGYSTEFLYGGDLDFTNMRGFLTAGGYESIVGNTDFPQSDWLSKWGLPDHKMYAHLYDRIMADDASQKPFFKTMLTLSSHEPFDVDFHRFSNPYVNSLAYADSCFGAFIDQAKQSPKWDNLLIIGVADHAYARYPESIQNHEIMRYRIPMFMTGGAIASPQTIATYVSQTDIAATLLAQMGIGHENLAFSKDMTDPTIGHFGFYTFSDGFGLVSDSCSYIQDNQHDGTPLSGSHDPNGKAERCGKAYLQTLYDVLARFIDTSFLVRHKV